MRIGYARLGLRRAALSVALLAGACAADPVSAPPQSEDLRTTLAGAYLAGRHAQAERDMGRAADLLGAALKMDPESRGLMRRTFTVLLAEGRMDEAVVLARGLIAGNGKMATQSMYPFMGGTQARRRTVGNNFGHPMPCADGWIIAQPGGGATWDVIADFFGSPELHEERFSNGALRTLNGEELDRIVVDSIKDRGKWEMFSKAAQARMLFGLVQTPLELADCPQLESRGFYREVDHPVIGKIKVPAVLFNFSLTPYKLRYAAPTLGQHNSEVYVDGLGYTAQELSQLRQLNAI